MSTVRVKSPDNVSDSHISCMIDLTVEIERNRGVNEGKTCHKLMNGNCQCQQNSFSNDMV